MCSVPLSWLLTPMCGRYRLTAKERYIVEHFDLDGEGEVQWSPRYNIAPTQDVPVIRQDAREPRRLFSLMRWGLVPYWAKGASFGNRAINAMAETAAEKPAFRDPLRKQRCLIPADGFYEWKKLSSREKQPYNIGLKDDALFAFAGLWDRWLSPSGGLETCTILTTSANSLTRDVHDRMPVILQPEDYDLWLDPGITTPARLQHLLRPFDAALMRKYPVSSKVGNPQFDSSECATEVPPFQTDAPTLF
jgi:putative SOS response-associated peptidase YedK